MVRDGTGSVLRVASWAYAASSVLGSCVAIREDVPGRPFGVGLTSMAGHLVEPVTWRPRSWTRPTTVSVVTSLATATVLATAGLVGSAALRRAGQTPWTARNASL